MAISRAKRSLKRADAESKSGGGRAGSRKKEEFMSRLISCKGKSLVMLSLCQRTLAPPEVSSVAFDAGKMS